jgi:hypothetical protein
MRAKPQKIIAGMVTASVSYSTGRHRRVPPSPGNPATHLITPMSSSQRSCSGENIPTSGSKSAGGRLSRIGRPGRRSKREPGLYGV